MGERAHVPGRGALKGREVDVAGVRLYLEERGAGPGPPALLAHGLGGNREVWSRVVAVRTFWREVETGPPA